MITYELRQLMMVQNKLHEIAKRFHELHRLQEVMGSCDIRRLQEQVGQHRNLNQLQEVEKNSANITRVQKIIVQFGNLNLLQESVERFSSFSRLQGEIERSRDLDRFREAAKIFETFSRLEGGIESEMIRSNRIPDMVTFNMRDYQLADWYHERIEKRIREFEQELAQDETFYVDVVLNDGSRIRASWFGYHNPNMIIVEGIDHLGNEVKLLLPHTNVQIVLIKVKKSDCEQKRVIGFQTRTPEPTEPD